MIEAVTITKPDYLKYDNNEVFNYEKEFKKLPILYDPNSDSSYTNLTKYLSNNSRFKRLQEEFKEIKSRHERIEFNKKLFNEESKSDCSFGFFFLVITQFMNIKNVH